jgi:hypothetical protein
MRANVHPINVQGHPLFTKDRLKGAPVQGDLRVLEVREDAFGRAVLTARITDLVDNTETILLELYDVALLWAHEKKMRMRGFEIVKGVQFAQSWDVELV